MSVGPYGHTMRGTQLPENPDLGQMPPLLYASVAIIAYTFIVLQG